MEITKKIRLANLAKLFNEYQAEGKRKNEKRKRTLGMFAEWLGLNPAFLSQMLNEFRGVGPKTARLVERRYKLPAGWMDQPHSDGDPANETEEEIIRIIIREYRIDPLGVEKILDGFKSKRQAKK